MQYAAEVTLPISKVKQNKTINCPVPGWKDRVKPLKEAAHFWHQIWVSCGRPLNTEIHKVMKRSRNVYHYEIRKCKKSEDQIRKNKILMSCLDNKQSDLFKEIKSIRKSKRVNANTIDGVSDNVPEHFKSIYSNLFNCGNDKENMFNLMNSVEKDVNQSNLADVYKVNPSIIKEAIKKIKPGKSDPSHTFTSDCMKVDSEILLNYLSLIIKTFLIHGHVTKYLLLATLVPIIKDKLGSLTTSKNYRSIAISSLILKILDCTSIYSL